jgi:hypothetical protein
MVKISKGLLDMAAEKQVHKILVNALAVDGTPLHYRAISARSATNTAPSETPV